MQYAAIAAVFVVLRFWRQLAHRPKKAPRNVYGRRTDGVVILNHVESRISPTYVICLKNIIRKHIGRHVVVRLLKHRPKVQSIKKHLTESNATSLQGRFAASDHTAWGSKVGRWQLHATEYRSRDPGPREGILERRSIPAQGDRKCFPTNVRQACVQRRMLKRRRNQEGGHSCHADQT